MFNRVPAGMELAAAVSIWTAEELRTHLKIYDERSILVREKKRQDAKQRPGRTGLTTNRPIRLQSTNVSQRVNPSQKQEESSKNGKGCPPRATQTPGQNTFPADKQSICGPLRADAETWQRMTREEKTALIMARKQWRAAHPCAGTCQNRSTCQDKSTTTQPTQGPLRVDNETWERMSCEEKTAVIAARKQWKETHQAQMAIQNGSNSQDEPTT